MQRTLLAFPSCSYLPPSQLALQWAVEVEAASVRVQAAAGVVPVQRVAAGGLITYHPNCARMPQRPRQTCSRSELSTAETSLLLVRPCFHRRGARSPLASSPK